MMQRFLRATSTRSLLHHQNAHLHQALSTNNMMTKMFHFPSSPSFSTPNLRCFSSNKTTVQHPNSSLRSSTLQSTNHYQSLFEHDHQHHQQQLSDEQQQFYDKNKWQFVAYNISRSINLDTSTNQPLNELCKEFGCWKMEDGKVSLILQLKNNNNSNNNNSDENGEKASASASSSTTSTATTNTTTTEVNNNNSNNNSNKREQHSSTTSLIDSDNHQYSYIVVYHFGSICFMNCSRQLQQRWISRLCEASSLVTSSSSSSLSSSSSDHFVITKDYLRVVIDEQSPDWCKMGKDHMIIQKLDMNNLNIISGVLSRSIALKGYEISAQNTLENFRLLNNLIEKTGKISRQDEKRLVPVFANANALKCDLLLSVRLLERPDVTWAYQHYDQIYEMLQAEFEIQNRFEHLDMKLDFIQQNNMFYMELQHSRKSETSEWLIIILIATEIIIALIHHRRESREKKEESSSSKQKQEE